MKNKIRDFHLHDGKKGAALAIRIIPRANENKIVRILPDGTLKVNLVTDPNNGNLNDGLILFLAEILKIQPMRFEIIAGQQSRDKLISIMDIDVSNLHKMIVNMLD